MENKFDQNKYQYEWRKKNMASLNVSYKTDFVDDFKKALLVLGKKQSKVFKSCAEDIIVMSKIDFAKLDKKQLNFIKEKFQIYDEKFRIMMVNILSQDKIPSSDFSSTYKNLYACAVSVDIIESGMLEIKLDKDGCMGFICTLNEIHEQGTDDEKLIIDSIRQCLNLV